MRQIRSVPQINVIVDENVIQKNEIDKILFDKKKKNMKCFHCESQNPQWISINNGIFLCLNCSGIHRSLGVQVSFIRSITMDKITTQQLIQLELGGNQQLLNFFQFYNLNKSQTIYEQFYSKAAEFYRLKLKELAEKGISKDTDIDFLKFEDKPSYEEGILQTFLIPRKSLDVLQQIQNNSQFKQFKRDSKIITIKLNDDEILYKGEGRNADNSNKHKIIRNNSENYFRKSQKNQQQQNRFNSEIFLNNMLKNTEYYGNQIYKTSQNMMNKFEEKGYKKQLINNSQKAFNYSLGMIASAYLKISDTINQPK